jgi:riboflavin synthase alpha subunit
MRAPSNLAKFIAEKGSVCLDGTSLTVNSVQDDLFRDGLAFHDLGEAIDVAGDQMAAEFVADLQ